MVHASRNLLFDRANDERPRSLWFVGEKEKNRIRSFSCRCVTWWWLLKSFRPPRKIQISYSLHFNTWLFSILSGFFNLWLWWSRAEGAAAAVWLQKSLGCDVILWKRVDFSCTTRLLFFLLFLFSIIIFYVKDGKWSFSIMMERHCGSRLLLSSFLPKKKATGLRGGMFFYFITFVCDESDQDSLSSYQTTSSIVAIFFFFFFC
jgi:hypothetical protein